MNNTRILILGAGVMQLPALRWAGRQGWYIYAADGNPEAVGASLAQNFLHIDISDVEGMIAAAAEIKEKEGLDGVFTAGTDFSYTVARVAEALDLPGLSPEVAYRATNKAEMRRVLRDRGVASPGFRVVRNGAQASEAVGDLRFPLVIKPVDNMGGRGIRRIDTKQEYDEAVRTARTHSRCGTIIVEEYIPGSEFSIDALVVENEVHFTGIADRHIFFPPYFIEMGHTIPTSADKAVLSEIKRTFEAGVHAIGIDNGAAKGDVKWDGSRAVIGEIAARLSGGYMSGWTYPYSSGVELTGAALQQAVGIKPSGLSARRGWVSAERAFISIPGIVESVENTAAARGIPEIRDIFIRVASGDRIDFPVNNVEKCGNCIAAAEDRKTAVSAAEEACRSIFVRLVPGNEETRGFLLGDSADWIPHAYTLTRTENITAMEKMPDVLKNSGGDGAGPRLGVMPLPDLQRETGEDWHGTPFTRAFRMVLELSQLKVVEEEDDADIILGALFWNVFLKGGIQAGVWITDTIRKTGVESLYTCG